MKEKISIKSKAHTVYKLSDGSRVPGTTTITGLRAKPQLIGWANKMGLQGIDTAKYTDEKASIGTLAHYLISQHLLKQKPDQEYLNEFSKNDTDRAENCLLKYLEWEKNHKIEILNSEMQLVNESFRFGGTIDFYGKIDGKLTLLDLKTGKDIWTEMWYQLAGYEFLLKSNGYEVEQCIILNVGRDETENFKEESKKDLSKQQHIFFDLLSIYCLEKEIRGEK
jgi:hypothetical protein